MSYFYFNPNPKQKAVGDCVVRGLCVLTDQSWDSAYLDLVNVGFLEKDMPSSNDVLAKVLYRYGYVMESLPNTCMFGRCYTVKQFCREHPEGRYLLATGKHVVAVIDGKYYDAWDSGNEVPIYYWKKENENATIWTV